MKIYTAWRKEGIGYQYVADVVASSPESAWRTAAETEPQGTRLIITADGSQRPPGLLAGSAAGLCEGVTGNGYLPESLLSRAEINIDDLAKAMTALGAEASNEQMLATVRELGEEAERVILALENCYKSINWEALIAAARFINRPEEV
jgi:hypothetical protein